MNIHVKILLRIILAGILLFAANYFPADGIVKFALYLIPYLVAGYDVLLEAVEGIMNREIFDEKFLMAVATVGALILGEYSEASAVMIFYQIGELFQDYAVERSRESITALMDIRPDFANIELKDGNIKRVKPEDVKTGSVIIIKPGEKIPLDGVILEGYSNIDTKALTGESIPRETKQGDEVLSGCINLSGVLRVKTTCGFKESTASKILAMIENAGERKSKSERFITRFARIYTPAVCICAVLIVIFPAISGANFNTWLYRALAFLVISCPCALVISVPLTFFAGVGALSRRGILVKGSNFLESLAKTSCVIFDKTGTLTKGVFEVTAVHPDILSENELLHMAAHVERYSTHPAADSLRRAYPNEKDNCNIESVEEIAGYGVRAKVNGNIICVGSSKFMDTIGAEWHKCEKSGTIIHAAINGIYAGHIVISDVMRNNAKKAVDELREQGIKRIVMLTGDTESSAKEAGDYAGIHEIYSELLPEDKVKHVKNIMLNGEKVTFIGDGINDAPVIAIADVGAAMGALGSDAAIEAADVVLMDDDPVKISEAVKISRHTLRIAKENIYFSVIAKILCLILTILGLTGMKTAVFADVGVMVIAVMNALRVMFTKGKNEN